MAERSTLPPALDAELDEVLSLVPLAATMPDTADRIFGRLVDALAEAVLHEVRLRHEAGVLTRTDFVTETCALVSALQERGLHLGHPADPAG